MEAREQAQQLQVESQKVMNKRLIEQENIRAWKEAFKAQAELNGKLALGTASTIALAMTPNTNYRAAITNAMKAAQSAGLQNS